MGVSGALGRSALRLADPLARLAVHTNGVARLLRRAAWWIFVAPLSGRGRLGRQVWPQMRNVGTRSLPIVALVSLLMGAILVLQTGDVMESYGQIQRMPGLVALSVTRELAPLMTAFVLVARVGASYTAVLAAMKLNEEVLALETMAIPPVGYLVAPRVLSLAVMMPCLTVLAYALGFAGGAAVAWGMYDISLAAYFDGTFETLRVVDLTAGLLKATVFAVLVGVVCCYFGFEAAGGPTGLGRYTMVAVVTSMVVVVVADAILTAFVVSYLL